MGMMDFHVISTSLSVRSTTQLCIKYRQNRDLGTLEMEY